MDPTYCVNAFPFRCRVCGVATFVAWSLLSDGVEITYGSCHRHDRAVKREVVNDFAAVSKRD